MNRPPIHIFNYTITNKTEESIDIHVDGEIVDSPTQALLKNWFDDDTSTSFKSLRNQIEQSNPKTINLYVNSPGGHVGDAMAIHDYLKEKETKGVTINRKGRGIIASAATYLLMGNNSEMSENSFFGIHNVHSATWGDIKQMKRDVDRAEKFNNAIVDFYSNKTGQTKEKVSEWMDNETWFSAKEAKDAGFVNSITGEVNFTNKISPERWEFKNQDVLRIYNSFTNINHTNMDLKKLQEIMENGFKNLLEKLGLKDKNDTQEVQNAFKEFSDSITNAIKESSLDEDKATEIVNGIITEKLKNFVTVDAVKDFVNKETLTKELKDNNTYLTGEFAKIAGSKTTPPGDEEDNETPKNKSKKLKFGKNLAAEYES